MKRIGPDKGFTNFMNYYKPLTQDEIDRAIAACGAYGMLTLGRAIEDMLRVAYNSGYRRAKKNMALPHI
jgi:hypothetical protein